MKIIRINPADNVAVALCSVEKGETLGAYDFTTLVDIPLGHKIAIADISKGSAVIKYGYPIGIAAADIKKGEHIHSHNLTTALTDKADYVYAPTTPTLKPKEPRTFMGFRRNGGRVGIRNEIWIIPTVGCVNSVGEAAARRASTLKTGSIDGIYSFSHPYGCSQLGQDHENTKKALCGLVNHSNVGGVLVLGLGCENNSVGEMRRMLGTFNALDNNRIKFLICQEHEDEVEAALEMLEELAATAACDKREPVSTSELIIGLKCGGSDGLSGITANPLVGMLTDMLTASGGSAILTEVPEMFGAETILMNRCKNQEVFEKTVALINDFKAYFTKHNQPVYENPSPGNKDGGITTLEDKALGCTQKAGRAAVVDVLAYGEPVREKGLNLLESPGNDLVASTALAVSGAHMVLFTTGRGTPFGCPVPTLKISSNSPLAKKKSSWIDFNAGRILEEDPEQLAEEFFELIIKIASGEALTKTEAQGIRDIAIFKTGVTL